MLLRGKVIYSGTSFVLEELLQRKPKKRGYMYASAAAAAKSLQSCPTLCDPVDGGPPGSGHRVLIKRGPGNRGPT